MSEKRARIKPVNPLAGELVKVGRGSNLIVEGYTYTLDRSDNYGLWRCTQRTCPGRAKTTLGDRPMVVWVTEHSHKPDPSEVAVKRMKQELWKRSRDNPSVPVLKLYRAWVAEYKDRDPETLPSFAAVKNVMNRARTPEVDKATITEAVPSISVLSEDTAEDSEPSSPVPVELHSASTLMPSTSTFHSEDYELPVQFEPPTALKMEVETDVQVDDYQPPDPWDRTTLSTPQFYVEQNESSEETDTMEVNFEMQQSDYARWQQVAQDNALKGDADVAAFLLSHYEKFNQQQHSDKSRRCVKCRRSIPQTPTLCSFCKGSTTVAELKTEERQGSSTTHAQCTCTKTEPSSTDEDQEPNCCSREQEEEEALKISERSRREGKRKRDCLSHKEGKQKRDCLSHKERKQKRDCLSQKKGKQKRDCLSHKEGKQKRDQEDGEEREEGSNRCSQEEQEKGEGHYRRSLRSRVPKSQYLGEADIYTSTSCLSWSSASGSEHNEDSAGSSWNPSAEQSPEWNEEDDRVPTESTLLLTKTPQWSRLMTHSADSDSPQTNSQPVINERTGTKNAVQVLTRTRRYQKRHVCKFCKQSKTKMFSHLLRMHKNEPEITAVMALRKGSRERREEFIRLLNDGDYQHNMAVIKTGAGFLIPKYCSRNRKVDECCPCPHCKGLYSKMLLSKHISMCPQKPEGETYKKGTSKKIANMLQPVCCPVSLAFQENVLGKMRSDNIARLIRADHLVLKFGERLFEKRDVEEITEYASHVAGRLRELGRLLQLVRAKSQRAVPTLTAAVDPANFDILIASVRELVNYDINSRTLKKKSLALRVGCALRTCSQILAAEATEGSDQEMLDKTARFGGLLSGNWLNSVSSGSAQSRVTKLLLLPTLSNVERVLRLVEADCKSDSYPTLAKATLALITMCNRKWTGKVQRMKVQDFNIKQPMSRCDSEVLEGLTRTEKKLASILQRVEIRKFHHPVPVLLTPMMVESLHKLLTMRSSMTLDSPYLFITPTGQNPFRYTNIIRQYSEAAGIADDAVFTAQNFSTQLATLSQALVVSKLDQDQLGQFLGRDIGVHSGAYQKPLEDNLKAMVASSLFRINRGLDLPDEITEDSLESEEITCYDEVASPMLSEEQPSQEVRSAVSDMDVNSLLDLPDISSFIQSADNSVLTYTSTATHSPTQQVATGTLMWQSGVKRDTATAGHADWSQAKKMKVASSRVDTDVSSGRKRKRFQRLSWTEEEKSAVKKHLQHCISSNRVPQKHEVVLAISKEPCLGRRSWKDVKYHVYNILNKLKSQVQDPAPTAYL